MEEPTVHKFLAVMSPTIASLGLFTAAMDPNTSIFATYLLPIPFLVLFLIFYPNALLKNSKWL